MVLQLPSPSAFQVRCWRPLIWCKVYLRWMPLFLRPNGWWVYWSWGLQLNRGDQWTRLQRHFEISEGTYKWQLVDLDDNLFLTSFGSQWNGSTWCIGVHLIAITDLPCVLALPLSFFLRWLYYSPFFASTIFVHIFVSQNKIIALDCKWMRTPVNIQVPQI